MKKGYSPETQLKHTIAGQEKTVKKTEQKEFFAILISLIQVPVLLGNVALSIFRQHIPIQSLLGFPLTFLLRSKFSSTIISSANALSISISLRHTVQCYQFSI